VIKLETHGLHGAVHKTADINSNDKEHPQVRLDVKAIVHVPITVEPVGVMLGGAVGEDIRQTVTIKGNEGKPLELEPVMNTLPEKIAYDVKRTDDNKGYQVVFRNLSTIEDDKYNGFVTFKTNYPEQPGITIQCLGYVWKKGTVVPSIEEIMPGAGKGR